MRFDVSESCDEIDTKLGRKDAYMVQEDWSGPTGPDTFSRTCAETDLLLFEDQIDGLLSTSASSSAVNPAVPPPPQRNCVGLFRFSQIGFYIEILVADEELADQVWELWNAGVIGDELAAIAWLLLAA